MKITHPFEPVCGGSPKILILGTMPSPSSREDGFYYGHPRNRFWQVLAGLLNREIPGTTDEKRALLIGSGIALWDVLAECDISGAEDSSIHNARLNDIAGFMEKNGISSVFANGKTAGKFLKKAGIEPIILPSTSPANAVMSLDRLIEEWSVILSFLG